MRRIIVVAIGVALGAAVLLIGGLVSRPLAAQSIMSLIGYGPHPLAGMSDQQVREYSLNMLAAQGLVSDGSPARIVMLHRGAAGLADARRLIGPRAQQSIKIPMVVIYQGNFDMKKWRYFKGMIAYKDRPVYPYVGLTFDESNGLVPSMDGWPSGRVLHSSLPDPELANLP